MAERVGIVGVGLMGQAFAHHLLKSGFEVQGFDIDPKRMSQLREQGGIPVESAAAAARGVRWVLTSLPTSDIVRAAVFGPQSPACCSRMPARRGRRIRKSSAPNSLRAAYVFSTPQ